MRNFKNLLVIVLCVLAVTSSFSQANILNAKSPDEIGVKTDAQIALDNDRPLEYGYVDDRDILYSRMIWEKIVLDERINFPLYYPIDTNNIGRNRRSLFDVLITSIENGEIKSAEANSDCPDGHKLSLKTYYVMKILLNSVTNSGSTNFVRTVLEESAA